MKFLWDVTNGLAPPDDNSFDRWLSSQLHALYDEVTGKPLPGPLDALCEEIEQGGLLEGT